MELVSIIMPAFNAALYLESSVESVLHQTSPNWELIIIDDASTDETLSIALKLQELDGRISVYTMDENAGVSKARNYGLEKSTGTYIAFLDSDDLWRPDKLHKQLESMKSPENLVTYGAYERINEVGEKLGDVLPPAKVDYKALLRSNFIGNLTGMYNASVLGKQYFSGLGHEDYIAWLSLVKKAGSAARVDGLLGSYRVYTGSISSNKLKAANWQWLIYRQVEELSLWRSCWYMSCYIYYSIQKRV